MGGGFPTCITVSSVGVSTFSFFLLHHKKKMNANNMIAASIPKTRPKIRGRYVSSDAGMKFKDLKCIYEGVSENTETGAIVSQ